MDKKTTKERILEAALTLFSEKGYDGVGVDEIAETIGMKGPSLYRHFKGKESILNTVIDTGHAYYEEHFGSFEKIDKIPDSLEELVQMSLGQIQFTMHDKMIIKFRKIFMKEQFRNSEIAELTTQYHITGLEKMYSIIFEEMMKKGMIKEDNPKILAMEYVAPVSMMIHLVDRQPEKEAEAMERIHKHFDHFVKMYGNPSESY